MRYHTQWLLLAKVIDPAVIITYVTPMNQLIISVLFYSPRILLYSKSEYSSGGGESCSVWGM